jgi:NAD(P)-dependent dehydrogenase (short-subunit alcohol dehydrogenase family)
MDLGLKDRVALVAASSTGLGKAVALGLAREGAKLALCARTQSTLEDWHAAAELNLMSTVYLAKEALPRMQQRRWGRFISITSVTVKQPVEGLILSNAVRAGVTG